MFICNTCKKSYIGETCQLIFQRFDEHKRSLKARDNKSALTEHLVKEHPDIVRDLQKFPLRVLSKIRPPVEIRITEDRLLKAGLHDTISLSQEHAITYQNAMAISVEVVF